MFVASPGTVRLLEEQVISSGVESFTLMRRAGCAAAAVIAQRFPGAGRFVVLCGKGNNGGDALVAAKELSQRGFPVVIYSTAALKEFCGSAGRAAQELPETVPFYERETLESYDFLPGDVIIDGLLGIGFDGGQLRGRIKNFIQAVNASGKPAAALDIPSGVSAADGSVSADGAVNAVLTVTFGLPKTGLFQGEGALKRGALQLVPIGIENLPYDQGREIFTNVEAQALSPVPLKRDCHKNSRGRVLVFGGSRRYNGAPLLAGAGALYSGSGLVRVCSHADLSGGLSALIKVKISANDIDSSLAELQTLFEQSDLLICGCGWGDEVPEELLVKALEFPGKLILDADALNMISRKPELWRRRDNVLITPHPGEAARVMKAFGIADSGDRDDCALRLSRALGCTVALKGRDTVVAAPCGRSVTVASGSPALATAGSGDVLCGVIAGAAVAGKLDLFSAALLGVYWHGQAGELADRVICADDLPELVGKVIGKL